MASHDGPAAQFTVPGLSLDTGHHVVGLLQDRLHALNELQLIL